MVTPTQPPRLARQASAWIVAEVELMFSTLPVACDIVRAADVVRRVGVLASRRCAVRS